MSNQLNNKIEAHDQTVFQILNEKKYTVDYFQREYNWGKKHIEQLIIDLTSSFLDEYTPGDSRKAGENYNNYYLGPFVVSLASNERSIIDGQQRLTSLTLLLIYLNNLQKELNVSETLEPMIFSELRGHKSFNIQVEERVPCLQSLFDEGYYQVTEEDDESTINMANRYADIDEAFPDELKGEILLYFIDWLKYNVILVEIIAYSNENAYTIFETMNDRGLNLTPTEMLKGFILSRFTDARKRRKANELWKNTIQELHQYDKLEDQRFFQAWLRGQYAETIRQSKIGAKNQDFEKIATRFHSWVRDNQEKMGLNSNSATDYESFVEKNFLFFKEIYLKILEAQQVFQPDLEYIYYIERVGIASSLRTALLLAPLTLQDSPNEINHKMNLVARYIETFAVRRAVNFRRSSASTIRYTMYTLVKDIRHKSLFELQTILSEKLSEMEETWDGMIDFRMHRQNKKFVKYLLSRMTAYIDEQSGKGSNFVNYFDSPRRKSFEIEHIWGDKFNEHRDEFEQEKAFDLYRNRLGDLVLLPRGTNQSYGAKPYEQKLTHYIKENLLVQSLCPLTYQNNPNFLNMVQQLNLPFQAHKQFKKADIEQRQKLYQAICEKMWPTQLPLKV